MFVLGQVLEMFRHFFPTERLFRRTYHQMPAIIWYGRYHPPPLPHPPIGGHCKYVPEHLH